MLENLSNPKVTFLSERIRDTAGRLRIRISRHYSKHIESGRSVSIRGRCAVLSRSACVFTYLLAAISSVRCRGRGEGDGGEGGGGIVDER